MEIHKESLFGAERFGVMDEQTKVEIKNLITQSLQEQSTNILHAATVNASKIVDSKLKLNNAELQNALEDQITQGAKSEHSFDNNINESNHNFCKQLEDIWRKAERAVDDGDKVKSKELLAKGKQLTRNRAQALVFADKEGWDVALAYLDDPLVATPDQEKRLKQARKEAKSSRESSGKRKSTKQSDKSKFKKDSSEGGSTSTYGQRGTAAARISVDNRGRVHERSCWICGRTDHISPNCTRRYADGRSYRY